LVALNGDLVGGRPSAKKIGGARGALVEIGHFETEGIHDAEGTVLEGDFHVSALKESQ
jgi:hypothetical protein